jgi:hypothetical protein
MTPIFRINAAAAHIRESFAKGAARRVFNDRRPMFIAEDPDKFGPGHVVIEDGKTRRMMITKIVVGFAQCVWFSGQTFEDDGGAFVCKVPHFEIVHTSVLTLSPDQSWQP